ncbi:diaminopimelate decarboxylase [Halorarum salinum]|uniref:Diaminopimelate decarboxylase n=1 Tax=Halorarum salinum TaxID=2743089 RepID=A0A7D5QHR9_9EURY|nr:diaminopimelate decarboxylase [Halobaculum salinum]QLG62962.1 diaminopimelate decarboxylase [Halobaculum salinum]
MNDAPLADSPAVRRLADWDAARLSELADEHGTPLYVTDLDRVAENCARLRAAFPDADLRYAVKANTARAVLEAVGEAGLGAECASAGEVRRALDAGFDGADVDYTAVNPPARDLDAVVEWWKEGADLTITVGAADALDRLRERGYDGRVCVRVNPGVGAGHHEKVRTGGAAKFGVPADRVGEVVASARTAFDVVGVHAHAGSGIHGEADLAAHREFLARVAELAAAVDDLEYVNVGGGIGVPYRDDEEPLDLDAVAAAVREELDGLDAALALEPGRYVVADAAVLLTRVNAVKGASDELVAGVDAGMTDLLRPAMYDAYHEIRSLEPDSLDREEAPVTVAGPICESGDVFCEGRPLPVPERGDLLALGNAGAYGHEMASTYNSRPRPADVTPSGDVLRERESLADLTRLER